MVIRQSYRMKPRTFRIRLRKRREVSVISHEIQRVFVIAVVTAILPASAYADDAGNLADRFFSYLDKNKDSQLDSSEFAKVPTSMRDWLARKGMQPGKPLLKKDFRQAFPAMMAHMRRAVRTASTTAPTGTKQPSPPPMGKTPVYSGKELQPGESSAEKPTDRLPTELQDGDLDKDGQISFSEWRKAQERRQGVPRQGPQPGLGAVTRRTQRRRRSGVG